jgi:hypothetical protein
MEDLAIFAAYILNNHELRQGLTRDAERSRRSRQASSTHRVVRGWCGKTLGGLAAVLSRAPSLGLQRTPANPHP